MATIPAVTPHTTSDASGDAILRVRNLKKYFEFGGGLLGGQRLRQTGTEVGGGTEERETCSVSTRREEGVPQLMQF